MKKRYVFGFVLLLFLDQLTKYLAETVIDQQGPFVIIKDFFSLTYAQNTGAAWSIMEGKIWFFLLVGMIAMSVMVWYFIKADNELIKWAMILMLVGTLGNFIDRAWLGYVRDFFDFLIFSYPFPVFNIADIALTCGVGLLIVEALLEEWHGKKLHRQ
jgi:signal peptidase II